MFIKTVIVSSLVLSLLTPITTWAKNQCACVEGSMTQCQETKDKIMMEKLGKKDNNYDKRFIDLMIPHHESGIMMAKDALKNSTHPEIKEMAQKVIEEQQKEIEQLKKWRAEWYGNNTKNHQNHNNMAH